MWGWATAGSLDRRHERRARVEITNGQNRSYQIGEKADAIVITLSENGGADTATFRLDIYALADEGRNYVGTINTVAAKNTPVSPARLVGYAVCPGARGWSIESFGFAPAFEGETKMIGELRAQPVDPAAFGLAPGVYRPLGRTIYNGNLGTATGTDSTAPLAARRTDFVGPTAFLGAFGSNESGSTIWIMFFDASSLPANGTQPTDGLSFNVPAGASFNFEAEAPGIFFANGLTWAASSTPNTLTAIAPGAVARVVTKATF